MIPTHASLGSSPSPTSGQLGFCACFSPRSSGVDCRQKKRQIDGASAFFIHPEASDSPPTHHRFGIASRRDASHHRPQVGYDTIRYDRILRRFEPGENTTGRYFGTTIRCSVSSAMHARGDGSNLQGGPLDADCFPVNQKSCRLAEDVAGRNFMLTRNIDKKPISCKDPRRARS